MPADAECIVSVIVQLVSRLEKDSNLLDSARKVALEIGKQVRGPLQQCVRSNHSLSLDASSSASNAGLDGIAAACFAADVGCSR